MIFTIEPMINLGAPEAVIDEEDHWTARTIDGKDSAQWEHTLLVTEEGCQILTPWGD
jgi:methionyl aminopeptidase